MQIVAAQVHIFREQSVGICIPPYKCIKYLYSFFLGRQTKQILVAKFQTLICLFAKSESSQFSSKRLLPFISTLNPNIKGRSLLKDYQMTGAFFFKPSRGRKNSWFYIKHMKLKLRFINIVCSKKHYFYRYYRI
jgi:hypothetical protein